MNDRERKSLEDIWKHKLQQPVWIYGLGTSGRLFADLCKSKSIDIQGIIVGTGYKEEEAYNGIKIYEAHEIKDSEGILIYTVKQNMSCVLNRPQWKQFEILDISSTEYYKEMLCSYYKDYFLKKDVAIWDKGILDFNGCRMMNPHDISESVWQAFLTEIGDLVLPPIWQDFSRIDEGAYEYGEVQVNKGDVVIDCGANLGVFSAIAAHKGATVYAFEPVTEVFEYLEQQAKIYPGKIYPVKKAVSDKKDICEIFLNDNSMTEGSLLKTDERSERKELISCITLDEWVRENNIEKIDYIKADIEGTERDFLKGGVQILRRFSPKLSICTYHRSDDKEVLSRIIQDANPNYKIEYKWKKLFAYVEEEK